MNMNYTNLLTAVNIKATSVSEGNEIKEADNTNILFVVTSIVVRKPNATSPLFITLTVI
jgi:hypothetical protein